MWLVANIENRKLHISTYPECRLSARGPNVIFGKMFRLSTLTWIWQLQPLMQFGQSDIGRGFWSWASAISTAAKRARFFLKCRSGESENRPILIDKESFADVSISNPATPARSSFQDDSYFITFRNCEIPFRNWPILFWYLCWTMTKSHLLQLVSIPTVVTAVATFPLKCRRAQVLGRICNLFFFWLSPLHSFYLLPLSGLTKLKGGTQIK